MPQLTRVEARLFVLDLTADPGFSEDPLSILPCPLLWCSTASLSLFSYCTGSIPCCLVQRKGDSLSLGYGLLSGGVDLLRHSQLDAPHPQIKWPYLKTFQT